MTVIKNVDGFVLVISPKELDALKAVLEVGQHCDDPELGIVIDSLLFDLTEKDTWIK